MDPLLHHSDQDGTNWLCFHRWEPYFAFHLKMLQDIEDVQDRRLQVVPEPLTHPTLGWLRREVREIAKSEGLSLSKTAERKAMARLEEIILQAGIPRAGERRGRKTTHSILTKSFVSVACGWFISGGFLDFATVGEETLRRGKPSHQRDPRGDLPASKGSRPARDLSSLRGASSTPLHHAIYADRHDDLAQAHVALLATTWAS